MLLVHQLNTGNLNPTEIDWASSQLRAWTRRLALEQIPRSLEGFFVDLAGREGLVTANGQRSRLGAALPRHDAAGRRLERAITALRDAELTDQGPVAAINQQRLSVLRKIQPAVSPTSQTELRRDPRVAVAVSARVRIGLSRICQDLGAQAAGENSGDVGAGTEQIEVFAVAGAPRSQAQAVRGRFARSEPFVVDRPDVGNQGPQRCRPAHRGDRRHRPEPDAWERWSRCANPTSADGCSASCGV